MTCTLLCIAIASLGATLGFLLSGLCISGRAVSMRRLRGLKEGLSEEERYAVADHAVAEMKDHGDPCRLNEEAPMARPPST
jgi:hypothetical protein